MGFGLASPEGTLFSTNNYTLALVIMSLFPLLAGAGGMMMVMMEKMGTQSLEGYAKAGELATEGLMQAQTVQSFGGEDTVALRYEEELVTEGC